MQASYSGFLLESGSFRRVGTGTNFVVKVTNIETNLSVFVLTHVKNMEAVICEADLIRCFEELLSYGLDGMESKNVTEFFLKKSVMDWDLAKKEWDKCLLAKDRLCTLGLDWDLAEALWEPLKDLS